MMAKKTTKQVKPQGTGAGAGRKASKGDSAKVSSDKAGYQADQETSLKEESWNLRLYVAGQTPKSITAFSNLKRLCEAHLPGRYRIEVIDLLQNPQLAAGDQIVAVPTLVRKLPAPLKRVIGNLSDEQKFLVGLDLKPGM